MCVYCEPLSKGGKRKKLFRNTQNIGSKGKLHSEAIISRRGKSKKYFINISSWAGTYVRPLGGIVCNFCPVCGRLVNSGKYKEGDEVTLKKDGSTWSVAYFMPNEPKPYKLENYGEWLEVTEEEIKLYE